VRTALGELELASPATLGEALELLGRAAAAGEQLVPLAGCTDVYVALNFGTSAARRYLDLWGLPGLRGIRPASGGGLRLGALTTFADIAGSALVRRQLPMLAEAARQIGGVQIQNRATIGGNVVNASPAADAVPVLMAAQATLLLASQAGERRVPITAFHVGYRHTVLRPDELLVALELPPLAGRGWFRKVGTRAANAIAKVVLAGVRSDPPRIAIGSVGPTVLRLPRTEAALAAGASARDAAAVLGGEIAPVDDLRSTAAYRTAVAGNLLCQFWRDTAAPTRNKSEKRARS
jgi:xanthine dehydrogenase small subunit